MGSADAWRQVIEAWFPPGFGGADATAHCRRFESWFDGGMRAEAARLGPLATAALTGALDGWAETARGRLALILLLDQVPRILFAGQAAAYAGDADALQLAEEGLRNGQYCRLAHPWERTFFFLPLAHAEGPDHRGRLIRVGAMAEAVAAVAPERLRPLYRLPVQRAGRQRAVIERFGRYPHRNAILGRQSTAEELAYLAAGGAARQRPEWLGRHGAPSPTAA